MRNLDNSSYARAEELRRAQTLRQAFNSQMRREGVVTSGEVLSFVSEFWTQIFVDAHIAERQDGYDVPWESVVSRLEGLTDAMSSEATRRLRCAWTPD